MPGDLIKQCRSSPGWIVPKGDPGGEVVGIYVLYLGRDSEGNHIVLPQETGKILRLANNTAAYTFAYEVVSRIEQPNVVDNRNYLGPSHFHWLLR